MTPPLPQVSAPRLPLPAGAWDCHAHVFGPFDLYPLDPACRYTPPLASAHDHAVMLERVGFRNAVLVHGSASGYDNRCTLDACSAADGRIKAIGVVAPDTSADELRDLRARGMIGLRFTKTGARTDDDPWPGVLDLGDLKELGRRLGNVRSMAHVFAPCAALVAMSEVLIAANVPIVFDHMGHPDVTRGVHDATFRSFLDLLRDGPFFVKLTPGRLSAAYPDFAEVRPFHDALVEAVPHRLVFGSDWPFLGQSGRHPDVGAMVDLFDSWTPDAAVRRKVFVDTPASLFG